MPTILKKTIKKRLDWSPRADDDRFDVWQYIYLDDGGYFNADLVYARIEHCAQLISENPLIGIAWESGKRRYFIPKTQLTIVYRVQSASIKVLGIVHQKRKIPK